MDELHERASELDIRGRSKMSNEELEAALADHDAALERAAELNIKGRTKMTNEDLLTAIATAEAKAGQAPATEIVPGEMYPHTEAIPQTGDADMGYSPAPENLPSVPSIELPSNVHDYSGGTHTVVAVPVATVTETAEA
jgi:hypothetical protein